MLEDLSVLYPSLVSSQHFLYTRNSGSFLCLSAFYVKSSSIFAFVLIFFFTCLCSCGPRFVIRDSKELSFFHLELTVDILLSCFWIDPFSFAVLCLLLSIFIDVRGLWLDWHIIFSIPVLKNVL